MWGGRGGSGGQTNSYGKEHEDWRKTLRVCVCWGWGGGGVHQPRFYKHALGNSISVNFHIPDIPSHAFPVSVGLAVPELLHHKGFHSAFHIVPPALAQTHPYLEVEGRESQMMTQRLLLPRGILTTSVFMCRDVCVNAYYERVNVYIISLN